MLTLSQALSIRVTIVGMNEVIVFIKHPFWCDEISHKQTIKCINGKPAKMYTERKLNWTVVTEELGDWFSTGHWGKAFLRTLYLPKLQAQEWPPCPWSCCASKYSAFLFVYSVNLCCLELYRIYTGFVFYIKAIILKMKRIIKKSELNGPATELVGDQIRRCWPFFQRPELLLC